jgi:hypothetical protein
MRAKRRWIFWAPLLAVVGCGDADTGDGSDDHAATEQPLNSLTAELSVGLMTGDAFGDGAYCDADPLELCIGWDGNCYAIDAVTGGDCRDPVTHCYDIGTPCVIATHAITGTAQDDHPLVRHPDDWDTLFIRNDAGAHFLLEDVWVEIDYVNASQAFTFVDEQDLGHWYGGDRIPLLDWVRAARERAVENQMGLAAGQFNRLPLLIQEAAYDLGQAGIIKYKPWEDGSQNGCDEYYGYFASQFSTNIHYSCVYDDRSCTYFRNWLTSNSHGALSRTQFQRANRLAQVVFDEQPSGSATDRVAIEGIYRLDSSGALTDEIYTPKPGDFFIRLNHSCVGNFHVMMYVGDYADLSAGGQAHFTLDILHKSSSVMINTWDITYAYLNRKVNHNTAACAAYEGEYYRTFYFGEADYDVDPDGAGPLNSGGRPVENLPVTGPNLGFRATQSAILNGTL